MPLRRSIRSLVVATMLVALPLLAVPSAAQEDALPRASGDLMVMFPAQLRGTPLDIEDGVGMEALAAQFESEEIDRVDGLLMDLSASWDDLRLATALVRVGDDEGILLFALQIGGTRAAGWHERYIERFSVFHEEPLLGTSIDPTSRSASVRRAT